MKRIVLTSITLLLLSIAYTTFSQVTLLSNNTNLSEGVVVNGKGFLLVNDGTGNFPLWVTTGTAAGTTMLTNAVTFVGAGSAGSFNNTQLFFTGNGASGQELWVSDATTAGTTLVKDINPTGNSFPTDFAVFNNKILFSADDGTQGRELWMSDGTTAGTTLLKDINPGAGSGLSLTSRPTFKVANGIVYFVASNGTDGFELWKTDGTAAGTTMVKDITAGSGSTTFNQATNFGTNLIFGVVAATIPSSFQLWKSDGTTTGTTMIKDFGAGSVSSSVFFLPFNNKIYFNASDVTAATGQELWVTDGTVSGTTMVKDINSGATASNPAVANAVTIGTKFYFQATTAAEGSELWSSDGTLAGTQLVKDINPGVASSAPDILRNFDLVSRGSTNALYNGKIFLFADDGSHGTELWISDGTMGGTSLVKDIKVGTGSGVASSSNSLFYFYTTSGLYFNADDGSGVEPWLSTGTDPGTTRVADLNPGTGSSTPDYLFILNDQLYFKGTNGDNTTATDLFKIDATISALPITLLNFSATVETNNTVQLNWTTASEINSSHFEIERSTDGNKFSKIGEVKAAGNSTNLNYKHLDQHAASLNASLLYYRLKLVDKDGASKTTPTLLVRLKERSLQFAFSPNPAQQQLNVIVAPAAAKNVVLRIVDATGKITYQQTLPVGVSVYQQSINISRLQKGVYYLQMVNDQSTITKKFIKQ